MTFPAWRLFILILAVSSGHSPAAEKIPAETYRLVHLCIFGADGRPAAHRDVYLRGWDRRALGPLLSGRPDREPPSTDHATARKTGWLFTTDQKGEVTVRIGDFAGWKDKDGRPGWGTYALLVEPGPDDSGGVSQRFWSGTPKDSFLDRQNFDGAQEWGELLPLPPGGLQLTMALHRGFILLGHVVDDVSKKPVANVAVNSWNDLEIDTHTGFGGQIFPGHAVTNEHGDFEIDHLYYNRLHLSFDGLWMTTQVEGKWVIQMDDVVEPPRESFLHLNVGVRVHPDFHYVGTVTDAQGRPVAHADVQVGISFHPLANTWGDSHHFEHATTDAGGHYDLSASSPWATFLDAETKELGRVDLKWPDTDGAFLPPGRYDLVFPPASTGAQ